MWWRLTWCGCRRCHVNWRRRWRRRRRRRRWQPQRRGPGEERIDLVPEIAPHPDNPPALTAAEVLRRHGNYAAKAAPAVGGRHVRRALREAVDGGVGGIERLLPRGEQPGGVGRRVVPGGVEEHGDGGVERLDRRAHVLRVHEDHGIVVVASAGEEVLVGEAEVAGVVVHGGVIVVGAELLRVLERRGDAGPAGRGVGVPAAERERVGDVRDGAGAPRREEGPRPGRVRGERRGEAREVGLVRVVGRVFAGAPAGRPRLRCGPRSEEEEEEEGGDGEEEEVRGGAAAGRGRVHVAAASR